MIDGRKYAFSQFPVFISEFNKLHIILVICKTIKANEPSGLLGTLCYEHW